MAVVRVGSDGSQLALFQAEGDEPLRQPHHVALRVPNPEVAEAALRAAGVPPATSRAESGLRGSRGDSLPLHVGACGIGTPKRPYFGAPASDHMRRRAAAAGAWASSFRRLQPPRLT